MVVIVSVPLLECHPPQNEQMPFTHANSLQSSDAVLDLHDLFSSLGVEAAWANMHIKSSNAADNMCFEARGIVTFG